MKIENLGTFALIVLLLVSSVSALVPSESAIEAAHTYLHQGEEASIVNRPYLVDGRSYFVVYFHPQTNPSAKNLIIVVDADTGQLVEDETILNKVYSFDYKSSFLQTFITDKKLSFQEIKSAVESGVTSREQASDALDKVESDLSNVDENIANIQSGFSQYTLLVERLKDEVDTGVEAQNFFESEYSNQALEAFVIRYNTTLKALVSTVKAGEDYQKAIINKSNQLTQKGVDQNKFKPGLQTAFSIGMDKFSSRTSLENAFQEFSQITATQTNRQVNDSIQSYLYRKDKIDTDNQVEGVRPNVEEILTQKTTVQECIPVTNLEKMWQNTLAAQSANRFSQVQANVTLLQTELNKIKRELDKCNAQVTPAPKQSDNTNLFIGVILLLIVGYFAWKFYSKKKQGENDGEVTQMQEPQKRNLFGD